MTEYLPASEWDEFSQIINDFGLDVNKDILIWKPYKGTIPIMGSDQDNAQYDDDIPLNVLCQFNDFRTWPITEFVDTGQKDKQSLLVYINSSYLESLDLLDDNGRFAYNPAMDRFIYRGQLYYDAGNTPVAPTNDDPLLQLIILKRVDNDNLINP